MLVDDPVTRLGSVDELVDAIARMAPSLGGIHLEDVSPPRCLDLKPKLRERLA